MVWIFSLQKLAAAAAGVRVVLHHLVNSLNRQQLWVGSWMARLPGAIKVSTFTLLGWLQTSLSAGPARWTGRSVVPAAPYLYARVHKLSTAEMMIGVLRPAGVASTCDTLTVDQKPLWLTVDLKIAQPIISVIITELTVFCFFEVP